MSHIPSRSRLAGVGILAVVAMVAAGPPEEIARAFDPPPAYRDDYGPYRSPLVFDDGRPVRTAAD